MTMQRRTFLAAAAAALSGALTERLPVLRGGRAIPWAPVPFTPSRIRQPDLTAGVQLIDLTVNTGNSGWEWSGHAKVYEPDIVVAFLDAMDGREVLPLAVPSLDRTREYRGSVLITSVETPARGPSVVSFQGRDALVAVATGV